MSVNILFDECLLDPAVFSIPQGGTSPVMGGPEYANARIFNQQTGIYKTAVLRFDPPEVLSVDLSLVTSDHLAYIIDTIRGGYGSGVGFRVRVPHDYSTTLSAIAGPGGTQVPNGALTAFKLYKTYTRRGITARQDVRRTVKPVVQAAKATGVTLYEGDGSTVRKFIGDASAPPHAATVFRVYFNTGAGDVEQATGWTVDVTTGVITFSVAPATGTYIKCTFDFDVPMAFTDNNFSLKTDVTGEVRGLGLREILPAELLID